MVGWTDIRYECVSPSSFIHLRLLVLAKENARLMKSPTHFILFIWEYTRIRVPQQRKTRHHQVQFVCLLWWVGHCLGVSQSIQTEDYDDDYYECYFVFLGHYTPSAEGADECSTACWLTENKKASAGFSGDVLIVLVSFIEVLSIFLLAWASARLLLWVSWSRGRNFSSNLLVHHSGDNPQLGFLCLSFIHSFPCSFTKERLKWSLD